jgi:hypothetical protein
VRVDDVVDAQAIARGEGEVSIDLAELGIDERGGARTLAADEVGLTTAGGDLLE